MSTITFVANRTSGTSPFNVTFYDLSNVSDLTSATDYTRTWIFKNNRSLDVDVETTTSAAFNHSFSGNLGDTFDVTLSAINVSAYSLSASYIYLYGPEEPIFLDESKTLNIQDYLPSYLKETEINDLVSFLETFLNNLYLQKNYTTSATQFEIDSRQKISIVEKINRLATLHDPDLVDIEYINFFSSMLGYSVDIHRSELGVVVDQNSNDVGVQEDVKRYLRFILGNLNSWNRIKTTNNSIKIMLYSFGLVGDLITRYTKDYKKDNGTNWINPKEGRDNFKDISSDFYPTSHFVVNVELDQSSQNFSLNPITRLNVLNAIQSIKPVNTVFDGVLGHIAVPACLTIKGSVRKKLLMRFKLNNSVL